MRIIWNLLFLTACVTLHAQVGDAFPELEGETLEENQVVVPRDVLNKITLIGMAYSKKSEATLKTWYTPMYDKFVLKRGMFDHMYDVNLFFVPMYTGGKKAAYGPTMKKFKEDNRKDLYPYLLFYKGNLEPYVSELKMENKNLPYFFMIDQNGIVLWSAKGLYSEKKMEAIEKILDAKMN